MKTRKIRSRGLETTEYAVSDINMSEIIAEQERLSDQNYWGNPCKGFLRKSLEELLAKPDDPTSLSMVFTPNEKRIIFICLAKDHIDIIENPDVIRKATTALLGS